MRLLLIVFFYCATFTCFGQTKSITQSPLLERADPESVGMSSARLSKINEMCHEAVRSRTVPGIVALIARNGNIVLHKAYGISERGGQNLEPEHIFRIASQTKAITATAVMMLWEEGKFRLDDPISRFIPEFRDPQVLETFRYSDTSYTTRPADKQITIRHLLTHTSGLGYGVIDPDERFKLIYEKAGIIDAFTTDSITIGENIKVLAKLPLHHNPGEKFTYSEGLDVLGYLIEIVSGIPFDEFLKVRVFDPLGMEDTWFYLPEDKADRLVDVMYKEEDTWKKYPSTFYEPDYPIKGAKTFFAGGAGLSSTAKDYATFLQMYLNKGELNGIRILSRTTVDMMMQNQIGDVEFGSGSHYGLAFGVINKYGESQGGRGSKGTFEWGGYFNTQYFADPEEQIIGILMKQTQGPVQDYTGWKFRQMVFAAIDD